MVSLSLKWHPDVMISDLGQVVQKPIKTNPGLNSRFYLLLYHSNFITYVRWSLRSVKIKAETRNAVPFSTGGL